MSAVHQIDVRFVGVQFLHQEAQPVAGVTDSPGIDHLEMPPRIQARQECFEPAAEGGRVVVWPAVRRGPPKTEDARCAGGFAGLEDLGIEKAAFPLVGAEIRLAVPTLFRHEQRVDGNESDIRVLCHTQRPLSRQAESGLDQPQKQQRNEQPVPQPAQGPDAFRAFRKGWIFATIPLQNDSRPDSGSIERDRRPLLPRGLPLLMGIS